MHKENMQDTKCLSPLLTFMREYVYVCVCVEMQKQLVISAQFFWDDVMQ